MFTLTRTQFYGSDAFKIAFDDWDCLDPLGPFQDIINSYAAETGIAPKQIQPVYQYVFVENDRKIDFYWDALAYIYVFNIPSFMYQKVYDRLKKICGDLNRKLRERMCFEKRFEPDDNVGFTFPEIKSLNIFKLRRTDALNVLEIELKDWVSISGFGPYFDVLQGYYRETGIMPKEVTKFYNYLFVENGYNIQLQWDRVSMIYIFYITPEHHQMIYNRLKKICNELNLKAREILRLEMLNKEPPPPPYRGRFG